MFAQRNLYNIFEIGTGFSLKEGSGEGFGVDRIVEKLNMEAGALSTKVRLVLVGLGGESISVSASLVGMSGSVEGFWK